MELDDPQQSFRCEISILDVKREGSTLLQLYFNVHHLFSPNKQLFKYGDIDV